MHCIVNKLSRKIMKRYYIFYVYFVIFALFNAGCRRPPANPPIMYEKEAKLLQERIKAKKTLEERSFLENRYPWEGKKKPDTLPERILSSQEKIKAEIELLKQIIYGPPKSKTQKCY